MTTKPKKPGPLTMNALEKWLKKQNPKTEYQYNQSSDCLMARFGRAQGYGDVRAGANDLWDPESGQIATFSLELDAIACYGDSYVRTYGGALEALQARKPKKTPKPKKEA